MKKSERDFIDNTLARKLLRMMSDTTKTSLATPTTPGGGDDSTRDDDALTNPMTDEWSLIRGGESGAPVDFPMTGADGDVLTAQGDGSFAWEPSTGGPSSGRYQNLLYELDGMGGFSFIVDDDGNPMYVLADLE